MILEGNDYKVNVLVLFMPGEEDVTVETVETLLETIEDGVIISVLMNGGKSKELKELFSRHKSIRYYESDINLGVAGGRNFLFETEEGKNADILLLLDNDVIPTLDYVRNISTFLLQQEDAAIVGPVIADANHISFNAVKHYGDIGFFGKKIFKINSAEIKRYVLAHFRPEQIYHMGTHPDYFLAYFSIRPRCRQIIQSLFAIMRVRLRNKLTFLRDNTDYQKMLFDGVEKIAVTNVGGGTQALRRSLLDEIGCLDDRFNPYGYEDVEFSTRALKAGYRNYIDLSTWIYHGTDTRHKERDPLFMLSNQFRCLTLYAASALSDRARYKRTLWKLMIFSASIDLMMLNRRAIANIKARHEGYKKGLEKLKNV